MNLSMELPPRARRIRRRRAPPRSSTGTTSACAENTSVRGVYPQKHGNYLRVRGEYCGGFATMRRGMELPPRARRIPAAQDHFFGFLGTTSACAENTPVGGEDRSRVWNYLRVRGEYPWVTKTPPSHRELPPRARRIRSSLILSTTLSGTTSACAENTFHSSSLTRLYGNYLRVRGEYGVFVTQGKLSLELPPRARRIRSHLCPAPHASGTTSACAENTSCHSV